MAEWNSEQYLKFEAQRTQPAIDLANRLKDIIPNKIIDLGCGPGNSTNVLKTTFPDAFIVGIDNAKNMIEKAKMTYPDIDFRLCDLRLVASGFDLIFSNACLQWVPEHQVLLPELISKLNNNGTLALQIPNNAEEKLFIIIKEIASKPQWNFKDVYFETNDILRPDEYYEILSECSRDFTIWESIYYHNMPSHDSLVEWVKGTRLRPYLDALRPDEAILFENEIKERIKREYFTMKDGNIILKFKRLFFIAKR